MLSAKDCLWSLGSSLLYRNVSRAWPSYYMLAREWHRTYSAPELTSAWRLVYDSIPGEAVNHWGRCPAIKFFGQAGDAKTVRRGSRFHFILVQSTINLPQLERRPVLISNCISNQTFRQTTRLIFLPNKETPTFNNLFSAPELNLKIHNSLLSRSFNSANYKFEGNGSTSIKHNLQSLVVWRGLNSYRHFLPKLYRSLVGDTLAPSIKKPWDVDQRYISWVAEENRRLQIICATVWGLWSEKLRYKAQRPFLVLSLDVIEERLTVLTYLRCNPRDGINTKDI